MSVNEIECFKAQAETIFSILYATDRQSMTYEQFINALELTFKYKIDKLVKSAKFHCGKDFMQSLGFEFNDDGDLIIRPLEEKEEYFEETVLETDTAASGSVDEFHDNPPPPKHETIVFDGDERKLHPGMYVKISSGHIYALPSLPQFSYENAFTQKMQQKTAIKYRKTVRELVENHEKMNKVKAMCNKKKPAASNDNVST
uniref:Uncharacterized protein n=1 Tax=Panagrolaimus sp. ES5 TaxID=591445 RepID=A0AC34FHJ4_9BILA